MAEKAEKIKKEKPTKINELKKADDNNIETIDKNSDNDFDDFEDELEDDEDKENKILKSSDTLEQKTGQVIVTKKKIPLEKKGLDIKDFGKQDTQKKGLSGFNMSDYNTPEEEIEVTEIIITAIPPERPDKQTFIRAHPTMSAVVDVVVYEAENKRKYLVHKNAIPYVSAHMKKMQLYPVISLKGNIWLFPVTLPKPGKKMNDWSVSREKIIFQARKQWIQCVPKSEGAGYDAVVALKKHREPEWPELTMPEYLEIAFDGYIIQDKDHPVVKALRGE